MEKGEKMTIARIRGEKLNAKEFIELQINNLLSTQ